MELYQTLQTHSYLQDTHIYNNAMAFVLSIVFSDFFNFDMSLLLLTVTLRGVSNKHCLLSIFIYTMQLLEGYLCLNITLTRLCKILM